MLGYLGEQRHREALQAWNTHASRLLQDGRPDILLELLHHAALSGQR